MQLRRYSMAERAFVYECPQIIHEFFMIFSSQFALNEIFFDNYINKFARTNYFIYFCNICYATGVLFY